MKLYSWLSTFMFRMTVDSRRRVRPRKSRMQQRIEALECRTMLSAITVTTTSDAAVHTGVSLRDAIGIANADAPGDTINFASNLTSSGAATITLAQGQLNITNSVTINGAGANLLSIDANNASRIFDISSTTGNVTISGLTLENGKVTGNGGAILGGDSASFNLGLMGDAFVNNTASGAGGAVFSFGGSSTNDTFTGNVAANGGALAIDDLNVASVNDTFSGNTATADGGAIYVQAGQLTTTNDTITANVAAQGGGIVATGQNGSAWVGLNTIVVGNVTTSNTPSDLYLPPGGTGVTFSATNSIIGDAASAAQVGITTTGNNTIGASTSSLLVTDANGNPLLALNGGTTDSIALAPGSIAIGAGTTLGVLPSGLDNTQTSLTFTVPNASAAASLAEGLAVGEYLKIDSEILQVTGVNIQPGATTTTVTVLALRGQLGTSAALHNMNAAISLATDESGQLRPTNDVGAYATASRSIPTITLTAAGGVYTGNTFDASATVLGNTGPAGATLEGVGLTYTYYAGATATGTPLSGAPTTAGTYTVVAQFPGSADYTAAVSTKTFTISMATPTVSVTDAGGVFTGTAFAANATVTGVSGTPVTTLEGVPITFTYYAGATATGTPLSGAPTTAGTYTVVASFAGSTDYASASDSTTFTISKATPTVSVVDLGGIATGNPIAATASVTGVSGTPSATLEGVPVTLTYYAGATATGTPLSGAPSAVGTYTVVASFAGSTDYASASGQTTFTITAAPNPIIIDDTSAGFSTTGTWTKFSGGGGYDNDYLFAAAGNGSSTATWNFTDLTPGQYTVSATWFPYANRATNAQFNVLNGVGGSVLTSATLNQQLTPSGISDAGTTWATIGTVTVTGTSVVVTLNNNANNYVIADAIQLQRVGPLPLTSVTDGVTTILNNGTDNIGTVAQGAAPLTKTITITNNGETNLVLQPATISADTGFTITSNFTAGQVVAPGATASLQVQMSTATAGTNSATISFLSSDLTSSPFTFTITGTVGGLIMDDTSPGFSTTGTWSQFSGGGGYDNDYLFAASGNGSSTATWNFTDLAPGQYTVSATWYAYANRATNAQFNVLDGVGGSVLTSATLNQQLAPNSFTSNGTGWQTIGTVTVTGTSLVVQLNNNANNYVIADAIQLQRVGAPSLTAVTDGATSILNNGTDNIGVVAQGAAPLTKTITVTNNSDTNLVLQPATLSADTGFTITSNFTAGQVVAPGASASLQLQMATSTVGTNSATVSFATSDSNNNPFTFNITGTVGGLIMDDTNAGFSTSGSWSKATNGGYDGDYLYAASGSGSSTATWDFTNLAPGQYAVSATWFAYANRATNAQFNVLDGVGGSVLTSATLNQQLAPNSFTSNGTGWQTIGTVTVTGTSLVVQLNNNANNYVIADAIQLQRITPPLPTQVTDGLTNIVNNGTDNIGTATQGSVALTKTITVTNNSDTNLVLQPATITADSGFTITSNFTAGQIVAPGASATLQLQMDTSTIGSPTATVSFGTSDPSNNPFTFTVTGNVTGQIMDDTSAGFSTTGTWTKATGAGYANDYLYAAAGNGSSTATWDFTNLTPGQYVVSASWLPYANRATNATFNVLDSVGGSVLASATLNQQLTPSSITDAGATWQTIGTVNVTGSTAVVTLNNNANGYVIADAIQLQRVGALPVTQVTDGLTTILNNGTDTVGTVAQGTENVTKTITVTNNSDTNLTLQPATVTANSGFTITSNFTAGQVVAPHGTATLQLQMDTSTVGTKQATVSFASSDANSPFSFNISGTVTGIILDDSNVGFSTTGTWQHITGAGVDGDYLFAAAGNGSSTATWDFTGLAAGQYAISASWLPNANRATNAQFNVLSSVGGTVLASATLNQQLAPSSVTDAGASFQTIGTVNVTGSSVVVTLNNNANGYVIADAIRLVRLGPVV